MKFILALILALFVPTALFGAVGTSPGNSGIGGGSGAIAIKTNGTLVGVSTNLNIILGSGVTGSLFTNEANQVTGNLIVTGGNATNAIGILNGRGTNVGVNGFTIDSGGFTNSVVSSFSAPTTFSSGVTNSGIVHVTGGVTHTAGVTNTGHLRLTGWLEASGNVTNSTLLIQSGPATFSSGVTNSGIVRISGGVTHTAGVTNSGHLRMTGWVENQAGVTNMGVAVQQEAPLRLLSSFVVPPLTNTALTVNQATNTINQAYVTNADFTVTFTGTPLDGARGQFRVVNTASTNITLTWPSSYSLSSASFVTLIPIRSNSIARIYWENVGGSNFISFEGKDAYSLTLGTPTAGQVLSFVDSGTVTNSTVSGAGDVTASVAFGTDNVLLRSDGTGKGAQSSGVTLDDSNNIGNPAETRSVALRATNYINNAGNFTNTGHFRIASWSQFNGLVTNTQPVYITSTLTTDSIVNGGTLDVSGDSRLQAANMLSGIVTNNITYASADINPTGASTNFQGDYTYAWRTALMTNHVHVTGMVNVASANFNRPYLLKLRNYSGGALVASVSPSFRRSGTNFVSVGNNQTCDIIVTPDGTGGVNETNQNAQITVYNSP